MAALRRLIRKGQKTLDMRSIKLSNQINMTDDPGMTIDMTLRRFSSSHKSEASPGHQPQNFSFMSLERNKFRILADIVRAGLVLSGITVMSDTKR